MVRENSLEALKDFSPLNYCCCANDMGHPPCYIITASQAIIIFLKKIAGYPPPLKMLVSPSSDWPLPCYVVSCFPLYPVLQHAPNIIVRTAFVFQCTYLQKVAPVFFLSNIEHFCVFRFPLPSSRDCFTSLLTP